MTQPGEEFHQRKLKNIRARWDNAAMQDAYPQPMEDIAYLIDYVQTLKHERAALQLECAAKRATIEIIAHCFETENDPADACNKAIAILTKALDGTPRKDANKE